VNEIANYIWNINHCLPSLLSSLFVFVLLFSSFFPSIFFSFQHQHSYENLTPAAIFNTATYIQIFIYKFININTSSSTSLKVKAKLPREPYWTLRSSIKSLCSAPHKIELISDTHSLANKMCQCHACQLHKQVRCHIQLSYIVSFLSTSPRRDLNIWRCDIGLTMTWKLNSVWRRPYNDLEIDQCVKALQWLGNWTVCEGLTMTWKLNSVWIGPYNDFETEQCVKRSSDCWSSFFMQLVKYMQNNNQNTFWTFQHSTL